ncbi:UNVERIFIED_CONTAM: G-type lectin S-receptor-like serine/threonine-protein kinase SD2-5 [Sesamum radiatum]|uniref:G-type lectin S-receptor-like serine/threonine-protein kinase SD2-5 n=1 Tax=Sesamum radiatum TaxID=300843 RepID=A0AAW2LN10_SESRA
MMIMSSCWTAFFTIACFSYLACVSSQPYDYPTANLSSSWINSLSANHSVNFTDSSTVRAVLLRGTFGPKYACGFYCNGTCERYLFSVFIVQTNSGGGITSPAVGFPQVVWSANRNKPVRINATLQLTPDGDLVLRDADGTLTWSTNTNGKSVAGLNLTEMGNLVLFDEKNGVVWQSFDHPTDALVPGQVLAAGMNLTAGVSATNWSEGGVFSVSMTNQGLVASVTADPPQVYYDALYFGPKQNKEVSYAKYQNGSLQLYVNSVEPSGPDFTIDVPPAASAQYMKLGPDGHLRVFEWGTQWTEVADVFTGYLGVCDYPLVCGEYGICSNGQCSCPRSSSTGENFRQINDRQPDLGCSEVIPLTCNASSNHSFLDLEDVTYFRFTSDNRSTDMKSCKEACFKNCSCKAAVFRYGSNSSNGYCYLLSQIFSLMNNDKDLTRYNSSVSLKVEIAPIVTGPEGGISPGGVTGRRALLVERRHQNCGEMPDGVGHIKKSFLAEVESIGSIHHVNLGPKCSCDHHERYSWLSGPEWINGVITEKVDVYSFGVVLLEILCGRKNFEQSRPEEERHLLSLFQKKAENGQWLDLTDKCCEDMQAKGAEVVEMMHIAAWCLQSDYANRPSMSMVVKVLEGVKDVHMNIDYSFSIPQYPISRTSEGSSKDDTPIRPSVLSGPR